MTPGDLVITTYIFYADVYSAERDDRWQLGRSCQNNLLYIFIVSSYHHWAFIRPPAKAIHESTLLGDLWPKMSGVYPVYFRRMAQVPIFWQQCQSLKFQIPEIFWSFNIYFPWVNFGKIRKLRVKNTTYSGSNTRGFSRLRGVYKSLWRIFFMYSSSVW
jgi:hypothetical protein